MRALPANLDAEQCLLGTILFDNASLERVSGVEGRHFSEPFHGRLFEVMTETVERGRLADGVTIGDRMKSDPAFADMGGMRYLADLLDKAPPTSTAGDYARVVHDLALRRDLMRESSEISALVAADLERDAVDLAMEAERRISEVASSGPSQERWASASRVVAGALEHARSRDGVVRYPTGLADVDAVTGGFEPGEMAVIAGRPGMAKSTVGLTVARANASRQLGTCFFSLEMDTGPLGLRIACDLAYDRYGPSPSYDAARKGKLSPEDWRKLDEAAAVVEDWPLLFDVRPGLTVSLMEAAARRAHRDWKRRGITPGPVIVDHLGIVRPERDRAGNKVVETGDVSRALAEMAKRLDVPVVALCQVGRANERLEDKRPTLADLRWSGQIEEDARQVILLYRPEYYCRPPEDADAETFEQKAEREARLDRVRRKLFWHVAKSNNGPTDQIETFVDVRASAVRDRWEGRA